ncbi:hypothetical protein [Streptomyces europaeiscabiei]|uniref:hypothetical protein n=1 Tax=Streptomyces europaeiscabiei TaxID=146819 RepID=UPI0029A52537|nr:hypothetical protein [Streptomyces europaeiscabiei]MDX3839856.1 hypothetical protein [Streptomyces europaeiscabiei]
MTTDPQTDRYRKRPVEIEARQWDGTADGAARIIDWILGSGSTATYVCSNPDRCSENDGDTPHSISIRTLEGDMTASFGDWIIKGVAGEFYPCRNDIFRKTYEPAVPVAAPPTTEQGALREVVAEALMGWAERNNDSKLAAYRRPEIVRQNAYSRADAVLAVLPAPADRAATLREAEAPPALCVECGHAYAAHQEGDDPVSPGSCAECPDEEWHDYDGHAEAQPTTKPEPKPEAVCVCGHPTRQHFEDACLLTGCGCADVLETSALPEALEAVLTKRFTELGNPFSRMSRHEQGPDGWPASHPVGPHHVAEVLRELLAAGRSADGRPELRLPNHTVNEAEAPDAEADGAQRPAPRDRHREAWNALTPQRQAAYLAGLDNAGVRQDEVVQAGGPSREATEPQRSDVGTEFVHQADHPDEAALDAVDADLATGEPPVCEGFVWIGQSFATCDRCAQPAWDHEGEEVAVEGAGPFDNRRTVRPWRPGQADAIRAKWGAPAVSSRPGTEQEA